MGEAGQAAEEGEAQVRAGCFSPDAVDIFSVNSLELDCLRRGVFCGCLQVTEGMPCDHGAEAGAATEKASVELGEAQEEEEAPLQMPQGFTFSFNLGRRFGPQDPQLVSIVN